MKTTIKQQVKELFDLGLTSKQIFEKLKTDNENIKLNSIRFYYSKIKKCIKI